MIIEFFIYQFSNFSLLFSFFKLTKAYTMLFRTLLTKTN